MYFDLQGIFISVVPYWLHLIPIDAYIKKITYLKYETALSTRISRATLSYTQYIIGF